jgi:O-antigen ligase
MRTIGQDHRDETALVYGSALTFLAAGFVCAELAPAWYWVLLAAAVAAGALFLAFSHTTVCCVVWLLVTGSTLEMALADFLGPAAFQTTIAVVKAFGIGLALLCALRWGVQLDMLNPAWGFVAMAAAGMAHGLFPGLTASASLRSLAGSVAPFVFSFCRVPRDWAHAIIRATVWCPLAAVAAGAVLEALDLRPLFIESGGMRLAGLGHPAFLAGVALISIFAGLIELYRRGRPRDIVLLAGSLLTLLLTGARAPIAYGLAIIGVSLIWVRSPTFTPRNRLLLVLLGAAMLPLILLLVIAGELSSVRLFNVMNSDFANLSGRQFLWPEFAAVAAESPWFGWGVGAGHVIIQPESAVAKMLRTWAAHNEYLRIEVEGGQFGRILLITLFVLWVRHHTARIAAWDRRIMRLAFLAMAANAYTDNVLISTPACVLFAFAAAVFSSAAHDTDAASRHSRLPDSARGA